MEVTNHMHNSKLTTIKDDNQPINLQHCDHSIDKPNNDTPSLAPSSAGLYQESGSKYKVRKVVKMDFNYSKMRDPGKA